ncbi:PRC-barrel domain-containing protein [Teichococcus aestuarii]|uniref:PRC-barrel domain-containing protein n=1 Tax=Teichococcus aestuarii TaxID=568898 RepID=UPI003616BC8B
MSIQSCPAGRPAWPSALVLSLALSLPAVPVLAQEAETGTTPLAERETLAKGTTFRVLGQDVKGVTGIVVGQVVNVLVDEAGQPRAAVLDYGGFLGVGRRRIAVSWSVLRFTPEGIQLSLSRDQLKNFPEYKEGEAVQMALQPAAPPAARPASDAPAPAPAPAPAARSAAPSTPDAAVPKSPPEPAPGQDPAKEPPPAAPPSPGKAE